MRQDIAQCVTLKGEKYPLARDQLYVAMQFMFAELGDDSREFMKEIINLGNEVVKDMTATATPGRNGCALPTTAVTNGRIAIATPVQNGAGRIGSASDGQSRVARAAGTNGLGHAIDAGSGPFAGVQPVGSDGSGHAANAEEGQAKVAAPIPPGVGHDSAKRQVREPDKAQRAAARKVWSSVARVFETTKLGGKPLTQVYGYELCSFSRDGCLAKEIERIIEGHGLGADMNLPIPQLISEDEINLCIRRAKIAMIVDTV